MFEKNLDADDTLMHEGLDNMLEHWPIAERQKDMRGMLVEAMHACGRLRKDDDTDHDSVVSSRTMLFSCHLLRKTR